MYKSFEIKEKETIQFVIKSSSFGLVLIAKSAKGVCALLLGDSSLELKIDLQNLFPKALLYESKIVVETSQIMSFLKNPTNHLEISLDERGTTFQKRVWENLRKIPIGSTVSYTDIAQKMHMPNSFRAVAKACAANILAIITPCHRVIRKDGTLSGYRWGLKRKKNLLIREEKYRFL